ncbi:MAG: hypothetical protein IPL01_16555 [Acidobacteria bacterium]|nr:hypothetical protein [Acidobacteriota bacterium]
MKRNLSRASSDREGDTYRNLADLLIGESRLPESRTGPGAAQQEEYFEFIRRDASSAPRAGSTALTSEEAVIQKRYREISDKIAGIGAERGTLLDKKTRTSTEEQRLVKLEADLVVAGQVFQNSLLSLEAELSNSSRNHGESLLPARVPGVDGRSARDGTRRSRAPYTGD